jgi:hypothetical protein
MWRKFIVVEDGNAGTLRVEVEELLSRRFPDVHVNSWTHMSPLQPGDFGVSMYQTRRNDGFEQGVRVELPTGTDLDTETKVQALLEQFCAEHPGTRLTS